MRFFLTTIAALCVFTAAAHSAAPLILTAKNWRVVDGDTIHVDDSKIRLIGIDAPETRQNCRNAKGKKWACGKQAGAALRDFLAQENKGIQCLISARGHYGRLLGQCFAGVADDGVDLQKMLVRQGLALSARKHYQADEDYAKKHCLGMWGGAFAEPKAWREGNWRMHNRAAEHCR